MLGLIKTWAQSSEDGSGTNLQLATNVLALGFLYCLGFADHLFEVANATFHIGLLVYPF